MPSNVWVFNQETKVDTSVLDNSNKQLRLAIEEWQNCVDRLSGSKNALASAWYTFIFPESGVLFLEASQAVTDAHTAYSAILQSARELLFWRERAIQLYDHAESKAISLALACMQASYAACLPTSASPLKAFSTDLDISTLAQGIFIGRRLKNPVAGIIQHYQSLIRFLLPWKKSIENVGIRGENGEVKAKYSKGKWTFEKLENSSITPPPRQTPTKTPLTLADTVKSLDGSQKYGQVRILEHNGPDGRSWTVLINGTKTLAPGTPNPQDMTTNMNELGKESSVQQGAVLAAMQMAGIGSSEPVEFVGHSQGGIVAQGLADNSQVKNGYNVVAVATLGSPKRPGNSHPNSLALVNVEDFIPNLGEPHDGTVIYYENTDRGKPHDILNYAEAARLAEAEPAGASWANKRATELHLSDKTTTKVHTYNTERMF
jgi:hypothetical protein